MKKQKTKKVRKVKTMEEQTGKVYEKGNKMHKKRKTEIMAEECEG